MSQIEQNVRELLTLRGYYVYRINKGKISEDMKEHYRELIANVDKELAESGINSIDYHWKTFYTKIKFIPRIPRNLLIKIYAIDQEMVSEIVNEIVDDYTLDPEIDVETDIESEEDTKERRIHNKKAKEDTKRYFEEKANGKVNLIEMAYRMGRGKKF